MAPAGAATASAPDARKPARGRERGEREREERARGEPDDARARAGGAARASEASAEGETPTATHPCRAEWPRDPPRSDRVSAGCAPAGSGAAEACVRIVLDSDVTRDCAVARGARSCGARATLGPRRARSETRCYAKRVCKCPYGTSGCSVFAAKNRDGFEDADDGIFCCARGFFVCPLYRARPAGRGAPSRLWGSGRCRVCRGSRSCSRSRSPPAPRRGDGRGAPPLAFLGRGDISTGSFLASAAHADAGRGFVGGFGGDLGDVPELPETRTVGAGAAAVPAVISQFENHQGVMAVGMVEELLVELNAAFCDAGASSTSARAYKCADFEDARRRLWMTFADEYVCGGLDDNKWSTLRHMPVQEQFEFLLAACDKTWTGDLVSVAREATTLFLAQSTLNRPDIKATVVANDAKAQRNDTLPTDNLYELHPGFYEALAPASTGAREPAVATWVVEPDLDGHTPYAEGGEPRQAALDARAGILLAKKGATEQYPAQFNAALDATPTGASAYGAAYRNHPSPHARWNEVAFCADAFVSNDASLTETCFPRVVPRVGVTHDASGRRLLTNRGQPLPEGYDDPNVIAEGEVVTGRRR